jgi:hypothetical protein
MSKFLTKNEFLLKIDKMNSLYWKEGSEIRWNYMSSVIEDLKKIKYKDMKYLQILYFKNKNKNKIW